MMAESIRLCTIRASLQHISVRKIVTIPDIPEWVSPLKAHAGSLALHSKDSKQYALINSHVKIRSFA